MNLRHACLLSFALVLVASVTPARTAPADAPGENTIPELFTGELEDVGPQYLLLPAAQRQPWELWTDVEITGTSNATLVNSNPKFSTITSVQAGVTWHAAPTPRWGGQLDWEAGLRGQTYRYGYLTGVKEKINFVEVDRNNFDLVGAHVRAAWSRGDWTVAASLRGTTMRNRAAGHTFYEELALEWQAFRNWQLTPTRAAAIGLEGAGRVTNTDSYGIFPDGWNDRAELGWFAVLDQALGRGWHVQPAVRLMATRYTRSGRSRTDWQGSARAALIHPLGRRAELRLSAGYDQRESTESDISDYHKWDLALAGSASWRF